MLLRIFSVAHSQGLPDFSETGNKEPTCCCNGSFTVLVSRRGKLLCLGHDGVGGSVLGVVRGAGGVRVGVGVVSFCFRHSSRCCGHVVHAASRHLP